MGKKNLSYWDEDVASVDHKDSKKKKKKDKDKEEEMYSKKFEDDDEDYDRLPLSQEYLDRMADILEQFLQLVKLYFIYPELPQEEYKAATKRIKKAVSRMRKGNTKDFDWDRTMEAIANGDIPEKYIDGGY